MIFTFYKVGLAQFFFDFFAVRLLKLKAIQGFREKRFHLGFPIILSKRWVANEQHEKAEKIHHSILVGILGKNFNFHIIRIESARMKTVYLVILTFFMSHHLWAQKLDNQELVDSTFGTERNSKFSFHQPVYFIFGDDDLKLQFSFKYRMARRVPVYFAYSQLMFWKIYDDSKPFEDVNYKPELFYRFQENRSKVFTSFDFGYLHTSNGKGGDESRSLERIFLRSNVVSKVRRHDVGVIFMVYSIYKKSPYNKDIIDHLGYWDATFYVTDIIRIDKQRIDFELRAYAGKELVNFDQGAYQIGLIYRVGSDKFNPSIYLQRFEGYAENLLNYDKRRSEWRLGLMLSF